MPDIGKMIVLSTPEISFAGITINQEIALLTAVEPAQTGRRKILQKQTVDPGFAGRSKVDWQPRPGKFLDYVAGVLT